MKKEMKSEYRKSRDRRLAMDQKAKKWERCATCERKVKSVDHRCERAPK
jgi:hypothetical protein